MTAPTNPYGWHLPLTDKMIYEESPYAALEEPAQNIAERLVMLAHLGFNQKVWGGQSGRIDRYWPALGERIESATNNPDVSTWWNEVMQEMAGVPLRSPMLMHEKNLLCRPRSLPQTPVEDQEVLAVLRQYTLELRDRARIWVKVRRDMREVVANEEEDE